MTIMAIPYIYKISNLFSPLSIDLKEIQMINNI